LIETMLQSRQREIDTDLSKFVLSREMDPIPESSEFDRQDVIPCICRPAYTRARFKQYPRLFYQIKTELKLYFFMISHALSL
jgi:hypothetical protein